MNLEHMVERLTREQADGLRQALELGKWADGRPLLPEHREQGMRALLLWEARHLPQEQRVGFMSQSCASKNKNKEGAAADDSTTAVRIIKS